MENEIYELFKRHRIDHKVNFNQDFFKNTSPKLVDDIIRQTIKRKFLDSVGEKIEVMTPNPNTSGWSIAPENAKVVATGSIYVLSDADVYEMIREITKSFIVKYN